MSVLVAARLAVHMRISSGKKSLCARALRSAVHVRCRAHDDTNDLSAKSETASAVFEVCAAPGVVPEPSRLDAYLTVKVPDVSRGRIVASIKGGLVVVNGIHVKKPSHKISAGDRIVCEIPAPPPLEANPEDIPLEVHYEDDHLMIVNKPREWLCTPQLDMKVELLSTQFYSTVGFLPCVSCQVTSTTYQHVRKQTATKLIHH